jgi:hypothetical protein
MIKSWPPNFGALCGWHRLHTCQPGVVTIGKRVIRRPQGYDDYDEWSSSDDDDNSNEEEEIEHDNDNDVAIEEEVEEHEEEDVVADDDAPEDVDGNNYASFSREYTHDEETGELIIISQHLIVSRGKLLMVRRYTQIPCDNARATWILWRRTPAWAHGLHCLLAVG